jgi:hypothetical protein
MRAAAVQEPVPAGPLDLLAQEREQPVDLVVLAEPRRFLITCSRSARALLEGPEAQLTLLDFARSRVAVLGDGDGLRDAGAVLEDRPAEAELSGSTGLAVDPDPELLVVQWMLLARRLDR